MNKKYYITICFLVVLLLGSFNLQAKEVVYISTDKDYYLAGESIWCSVYCFDESEKQPTYSKLSNVAYIEFHNQNGIAASIKTGLITGRGCGRFEIPLSIPTGNYSIVAYTKHSGGDSKKEYNGKIVTIFNTLTNERVKDGVEIVDRGKDISSNNYMPKIKSGDLEITIPQKEIKMGSVIPLSIKNTSGKNMSLNVSVYHLDKISSLIGENGYNSSRLLERKGDFELTSELEYEGEIINARITPKNKALMGTNSQERNVFMSAIRGSDDIYITNTDEFGNIKFYTGNIYGNRDLVFDVTTDNNVVRLSESADTSNLYNVEIINKQYKHNCTNIPILRISSALLEALSERSVKMQISKRFEADTIFDLIKFSKNPLLGEVKPVIYNLDEYTRFQLMEEVVREFIKEMRIRKFEGNSDFQVLLTEGKNMFIYSEGNTLTLLDGVPIRDHSILVKLDPLTVKQIAIYKRRFVIGDYLCDGIVNFITYKGEMGGVKLPGNISIVNYKGVQYSLAFTGNNIAKSSTYPNYNETIYWNPIVNINKHSSFDFNCLLPQYNGKFKIVIEGIDENNKDIYYSAVFSL